MTVIEKLTGEKVLDEGEHIDNKIMCYIIPERFLSLTNENKKKVTTILQTARQEGIVRVSKIDATLVLNLGVINSEFHPYFDNVVQDPRTSEQKEQAINQAIVEIF